MSDESLGLRALIDMGSNGIRFSISDLRGPTARIIPTIFQDRANISLYNTQWSTGHQRPIPQAVIDDIVFHFQRFKVICLDFGVGDIDVLATEATRVALNSNDFQKQILSQTGLKIRLLSKTEESLFGAYGIASSLVDLEGLAMDLGGGSTQLSWISAHDGEVRIDEGKIFSLPYGAAALSRRVDEARASKRSEELFDEMVDQLEEVYEKLDIPPSANGSLQVYLSGGGWRRIGHVFMADHGIEPYPIPIINGFSVPGATFAGFSKTREQIFRASKQIFGVSKAKAHQLSAVEVLVQAINAALPPFRSVNFCQGGIREGYLFSLLPQAVRAQHPLEVATAQFARPFASIYHSSADSYPFDLLTSSLPKEFQPDTFRPVLQAIANMHLIHSSIPSDGRPAAALHSVSTGLLASCHGLDHSTRGFLGVALCERWGGKVAPTDSLFKKNMELCLGGEMAWWAAYFGRVAGLIGAVYPAARYDRRMMAIESRLNPGKEEILLQIKLLSPRVVDSYVDRIEKVGGKARGDHGMAVRVSVLTAS